jgi:hypothetical protein
MFQTLPKQLEWDDVLALSFIFDGLVYYGNIL